MSETKGSILMTNAKMDALEDAGWFQNDKGWWHPPSCLASWPLAEAWKMFQRDQDRDAAQPAEERR